MLNVTLLPFPYTLLPVAHWHIAFCLLPVYGPIAHWPNAHGLFREKQKNRVTGPKWKDTMHKMKNLEWSFGRTSMSAIAIATALAIAYLYMNITKYVYIYA